MSWFWISLLGIGFRLLKNILSENFGFQMTSKWPRLTMTSVNNYLLGLDFSWSLKFSSYLKWKWLWWHHLVTILCWWQNTHPMIFLSIFQSLYQSKLHEIERFLVKYSRFPLLLAQKSKMDHCLYANNSARIPLVFCLHKDYPFHQMFYPWISNIIAWTAKVSATVLDSPFLHSIPILFYYTEGGSTIK